MLQRCNCISILHVVGFEEVVDDVLECIRDPIRDEACNTPLPGMPRNRVKVFVGPVYHQSAQKSIIAHLRARLKHTIANYPPQKCSQVAQP
jgi:hypothetical protein